MHVRVVKMHVPPDKIDGFIQLWQNEMLPTAKAQNGWRGAQLFVDRATGNTRIVGFWETEADARATGNMGGAHVQTQQDIAASLMGERPTVEMEYYEVAGEAWEERAAGT